MIVSSASSACAASSLLLLCVTLARSKELVLAPLKIRAHANLSLSSFRCAVSRLHLINARRTEQIAILVVLRNRIVLARSRKLSTISHACKFS